MSHIFISYSRKDSKCAYKVQRKLEAQGYQIWIDKNDIDAGDPFPQRILEAISESSVFILLWSANSAGSPYVEAEIEEAVNQRMQRKLPLIPVSLDKSKLHPKLGIINTLALNDCAMSDIENLIHKFPKDLKQSLSRKFADVDVTQKIEETPSSQVIGTDLVVVPYLDSWYCEAFLVAEKGTILADHLALPKPYIALVPQFLGDTTDATIEQVYNSLKSELEGQQFVALHIKPKQEGRISINVQERGQTLDIINTSYSAIFQLVNRNRSLATVKLCTPMLTALSASVTYLFDTFWHLQVYHFERNENQYHLLFDSKDL